MGQLNPLALPQAKLTAALGVSDTTVSVDSTTGFPTSGQIVIDTEVISYGAVTGNSIAVSARAQASTTAVTHSSGAVVTVFPLNAGLLTSAIDDKATTLNINSAANFPAGNGAVFIDQEILAYSSGTATSLTGLIRAVQGTKAAAHNAGAVIISRAASPPVQTYVVPRMLSANDNFSGLAIANLSDGPANVTVLAIKSDGGPLTVAGANNTQTQVSSSFTVLARQQYVASMTNLFGDIGTANDFYAQVNTGNPNALGVTPIGNTVSGGGINRLDVAPISTRPQTDVIIPVALQGSTQYGGTVGLEIGVVTQLFGSGFTADFVDANGNVLQTASVTAGGGQRVVKGLTDLFSNLKDQTVESGYVHLTSLATLTAYEDLTVGNENAYLTGVPRSEASTLINIPLAISGNSYTTRLLITDGTAAVSGQPPVGVVNVRLTAYNSDGSLLSGTGITNPVVVTFPVSGQYSKFINDVFGIDPRRYFFGYLKLELASGSSTSGVIASALLLQTAHNQLTAIPGQTLAKTNLTVTPALFDPTITTAMSLVNPNASDVSARIRIIRGDGSVQATQNMTIPSLGQAIPVFATLFPGIGQESDGYVVVDAPQPIYGMIVYDNGTFLASGFPLGLPDSFVLSPNPINLAIPLNSSVPANAISHLLTIQIPNPAPPGGIPLTLQIQNSTIASLPTNAVTIPEGQRSATVMVSGNIGGATVVVVTSPQFNPATVVVSVQNVSDFTLARNVSLTPSNPVVLSGGTLQFSVAYDTTNIPPVVWRVAGIKDGQNAIGTITQSGFYVAPLLLPTDQPLRVAVSVTNDNTSFFGATTIVTILPPSAQ